jgi:HEAT repeat protein
MWRRAAMICCVLCCIPLPAIGQMWTDADGADVDRFVRDHLNQPIDNLMPALASAMNSASPGTRGGALSVITARCGFPTLLSSPLKENYLTDVARLRELIPTVEQLLKATHEQLRHEAFKAYACLTSTPEETGWRMANGTIARFLESYLTETSPAIRSEITKTFALSTNDTPEIRTHLLTLLKSSNAGERAQAEIALRRFFPRDRIGELLTCVSDTNVWMRYACAIALRFYPDEAAPQLAKLEAALKAERDSETRRQLQRTVDLLRRWPKG